MPIFVVERRTGARGTGDLHAEHRALAEAARRVSVAGPQQVTYVRSYVVPERSLGVFEATEVALVQRVHEIAQVRFERIDEALAFEMPGRAPP